MKDVLIPISTLILGALLTYWFQGRNEQKKLVKADARALYAQYGLIKSVFNLLEGSIEYLVERRYDLFESLMPQLERQVEVLQKMTVEQHNLTSVRLLHAWKGNTNLDSSRVIFEILEDSIGLVKLYEQNENNAIDHARTQLLPRIGKFKTHIADVLDFCRSKM